MAVEAVVLEILFIEPTVVCSVPLDGDPKGLGGFLMLSFSSKSVYCCGRLNKVDLLETRKMIDKKDCATKTLVGESDCRLWDKARLGGDDGLQEVPVPWALSLLFQIEPPVKWVYRQRLFCILAKMHAA